MMDKLIEAKPKVTAERGLVRVELRTHGLDGHTETLTGERMAFTRHAAYALLAGLAEALDEPETIAIVEKLRA